MNPCAQVSAAGAPYSAAFIPPSAARQECRSRKNTKQNSNNNNDKSKICLKGRLLCSNHDGSSQSHSCSAPSKENYDKGFPCVPSKLVCETKKIFSEVMNPFCWLSFLLRRQPEASDFAAAAASSQAQTQYGRCVAGLPIRYARWHE